MSLLIFSILAVVVVAFGAGVGAIINADKLDDDGDKARDEERYEDRDEERGKVKVMEKASMDFASEAARLRALKQEEYENDPLTLMQAAASKKAKSLISKFKPRKKDPTIPDGGRVKSRRTKRTRTRTRRTKRPRRTKRTRTRRPKRTKITKRTRRTKITKSK